MARKPLRELLVEDQEPFLLQAYISDRRRQLNKPPRPLARRKSASFGESLLKNANACFSSSSSSSPLPPRLYTAAAIRAQAKTAVNNTVLLHVPTRTAAMLLEAALRIENCDLKGRDLLEGTKQGKSGEGAGVSTVASLFRRFSKFGRRLKKNEFEGSEGEEGVPVRDILGWNNSGDRQEPVKANTNTSKNNSSYIGNCPCSKSEQSTTPLYESGGGRESFGNSEGSDLMRSPFRYPTPELHSLTVSPTHSISKDKLNLEENDPREIRPDELEEEQDVEKEQSSPVSVLDPPLYDDDNVCEHRHSEGPNNDEYADGLDYEASYTRTKQQLLRKLYRFERLVGLDPVDLQGRLIEHDHSEEEDEDGDVCPECGGDDSVGNMSLTRGMVKFVSDLIVREQQHKQSDHGVIGKLRQGYFRQHVMVRWDQEEDHLHHLVDTAEEIEVSILGLLVEEFSEDLCLKRIFD